MGCYCPICRLQFDDFEDYREHAKKEFGKIESFTKCCNANTWFFDSAHRLRCDKCSKYTIVYDKYVDYIVPPLMRLRNE